MVYPQRLSTLLFLVFFKSEVYGGASITIFDNMIVRNVFMTKPKQTWLQCLELCTNDPRCFAYSFGPVGEEFGHCALTMECEIKCLSCQGETIEVKGNVVHIVRPRRNNNGCHTKVSAEEGTKKDCQASNNYATISGHSSKVNISSNATSSGHGPKAVNVSSNATSSDHSPKVNISGNATSSGHGPKVNISSNATSSGHGPKAVNISSNAKSSDHGPKVNISSNVTSSDHSPKVNISGNATSSGHGPKVNISSNATSSGHGPKAVNISSNAKSSDHGPKVNISSNVTSSGHGPKVNNSSNATTTPPLPISQHLVFNVTLSCPKEAIKNIMTGKKKVTICEGKSGKIHCAPKYIVIEDAKYGRDQGCSCECDKCYNLSTECYAVDVVAKVKQKCQKQKVCKIEATNTKFGNPCDNVLKRLVVEYSCQ